MAKTDPADTQGVPPQAPDEIIEAIRSLAPSARTADALTLWQVGDLLYRLRAMGEDAPVARVAGTAQFQAHFAGATA